MASFSSRIFNFLIRHNYIFQGRLRKERFDSNTSIAEFRERCEKGAEKYAKIPKEISVKQMLIEGIKSEFLIPKGANDKYIIMFVHGGGYVSGSCSDHRGFVAKLAFNVGITSLLYEYRLAPEAPFPAALDDSLAIYEWLLKTGYSSENIIIAGESAGGGLSLAILLALKERNISLPKACVAISPWTDLTCSSDSYKTKNHLSPAPLDSWLVFSKYYAGKENPTNPLISPLFGDLRGLPPIFINSAEDDELFEDGEKFYLKAKKCGVDVTFRAGQGMIHCYPLLSPMFKEAKQAMDEIIEFIKLYLA